MDGTELQLGLCATSLDTGLTNAYIGQGDVFGGGSGPILEGVQCSRTSMRICTCLPDSPPCGGCDHSKDVGVACASMWM